MTMFITIATLSRIVQASDRRISLVERGRLVVRDDDTNKAIVVDNDIGRFSLVFCGLAEIDGIPTAKLITDLLVKCRPNNNDPHMYFGKFLELLSEKMGGYNCDMRYKRLHINVAGFLINGLMFYLNISNVDENKVVSNEFGYKGKLYDNATAMDKYRSIFSMIDGDVSLDSCGVIHNKFIRPLRRSRFFHKSSEEDAAMALVRMIRYFANNLNPAGTIGPNCMTTVLNAPPSTLHSFQYHQVGSEPIQHGPNFVYEAGAFCDFRVEPHVTAP